VGSGDKRLVLEKCEEVQTSVLWCAARRASMEAATGTTVRCQAILDCCRYEQRVTQLSASRRFAVRRREGEAI